MNAYNPKRKWNAIRSVGLFLILVLSGSVYAAEKERTPESLLKVIEQRDQELQRRLKAVSVKEQRLRMLEQELFQKLEELKKLRDDMKARETAEKKAKALEDAKKAKALSEEKKASALEEAQTPAKEKEKQVNIQEQEKKAKTSENAKASQEAKKSKLKEAAERRLAKAKVAAEKRKAKAVAKKAKKKTPEETLSPEKLEEMAAINKKEAERKALEEKRFKDLARVYDKMPPAEAALRLQNMHEITALEIIPRMNKARLARVLSSMDPVVAVRYTERIGMGGPFFPTDTPPLNPPPPSKAAPQTTSQ